VATISRQTSRIGAVAGGGYHAGAIEALGLELVDEGRELVLVAAGHDQARALTQQAAGYVSADVPRRAGEDDYLAIHARPGHAAGVLVVISS
jgi:hypothetical protein